MNKNKQNRIKLFLKMTMWIYWQRFLKSTQQNIKSIINGDKLHNRHINAFGIGYNYAWHGIIVKAP